MYTKDVWALRQGSQVRHLLFERPLCQGVSGTECLQRMLQYHIQSAAVVFDSAGRGNSSAAAGILPSLVYDRAGRNGPAGTKEYKTGIFGSPEAGSVGCDSYLHERTLQARRAVGKLSEIIGDYMEHLIVELSKYLMILLFAWYTFTCFHVLSGNKSERRQKRILKKQTKLIFLIHLNAFAVIFEIGRAHV